MAQDPRQEETTQETPQTQEDKRAWVTPELMVIEIRSTAGAMLEGTEVWPYFGDDDLNPSGG